MSKITLKFNPNKASVPRQASPPLASPLASSPIPGTPWSVTSPGIPQIQPPPLMPYAGPVRQQKPKQKKPKKPKQDYDFIDEYDSMDEKPKKGKGGKAVIPTTQFVVNGEIYDELDPADHVEEQIILRLPMGPDAERLRNAIMNRVVPDDFTMSFHDDRRATITMGGNAYASVLVDLPTIIESQKTFDKKVFYKVADISQMLIVSHTLTGEALERWKMGLTETPEAQINWPHGLSVPLMNVRSQRFRKRISKRAIEDVESQVKRLLEADDAPGTVEVKWEWVDPKEVQKQRAQEEQAKAQSLANRLREAAQNQQTQRAEEEDDEEADVDLDQMAQELEADLMEQMEEEESSMDEGTRKEIEKLENQRDKFENQINKLGVGDIVKRQHLRTKIAELDKQIESKRGGGM